MDQLTGKKTIEYLEKRKNYYKSKFNDKLAVNKEYQKLQTKFNDFLISWAQQNVTYEKKLNQAIEDVVMESKRTCTFHHLDMFASSLQGRLKMKKTKFWDDYEKIRGMIEDHLSKALCDSTELHKEVKKLIKAVNHSQKRTVHRTKTSVGIKR